MKYPSAAKVLFFINLLFLHCLPSYCDIKQDDSIPSENLQAHKILPADPSRIGNVPSQQKEAENVNLDLENVEKENVQSSVEYVNNIPEEKDAKQFVDQIVHTDTVYKSTEKTKHNEGGLKSSRSTDKPNSKVVNEIENSEQATPMSEDSSIKNIKTESLSEETVFKPSEKGLPDKVPKISKRTSSGTGTSTEADKLIEAEYASVVDQGKVDDGMHQQYDGMPSFDEWKKMMLAEQASGGKKVPLPLPPGKKISSQKRRRNYSSYECGAKIVASNNEAERTSRILNELVDEYMLNPCKAKIWFVIALCETVQALQIELANFELFSSCPKDFAVYSSDNFPTRDWIPLGTFTAAELRSLQSFELKQKGFGKFIKIELLSHYGKEYYCPLSVVRIFGTSMVDEYEEMEILASRPDIPDDDLDRLDIPVEDAKSTNIFGSATDAVMNIVKKAARALGQHPIDEKKNETSTDIHNVSESKTCSVVDSSTEKCTEPSDDKDTLPPVHSFSVYPSMRQSLFRLLYRCDQCVSSHIRYYSSAQPHCRFFQAALGPVMFQTLCDWFKEHPLAIAHESPAPGKKGTASGTFTISPTKSPPPQIMRIASEGDLALTKLLNDSLSSADQSEQSVTINVSTLASKTNKSAPLQDKTMLQSSIKPTQTLQNDHSSALNESADVATGSLAEESAVPVASSVNEQLTKVSLTIPEKTESSDIEGISETATVTTGDYSSSSEGLTESEQQQIKEFLAESSTVTTDDLAIDLVPATEMPSSFKSDEEKLMDMRNEIQGKHESYVSIGSAGQKESVLMRMSNRIKDLEINMSLSSRYLQELSQRYRRQMEEMQRAFNRNIGTLNDTARKAAEKDLKQQEILNSLQLQVANLSETVVFLLNERSSLLRQTFETHVCLMIIEAIAMITIMSLCVHRISNAKQSPSESRTPIVSPSRRSQRRNSAESCSRPIARTSTKRSNSEENLNADILIFEPLPVLLDPMLKVSGNLKRPLKKSQKEK